MPTDDYHRAFDRMNSTSDSMATAINEFHKKTIPAEVAEEAAWEALMQRQKDEYTST